MKQAVVTFLIVLIASVAVSAKATTVHEMIEGPVFAEIVRVVDGDTILVNAAPWPQQTIEVYVRLRGIDAPELHSKCSKIREQAEEAQAALEKIMPASGEVRLTRISGDKYFGRILADVTTVDGTNPAQLLLAAGRVVRYGGGRKAAERCDR